MKKTNFFKMVMTLVLAFVITGAFAQTHEGTPVTGQANTTYASDGVTYMVAGDEIPVYALPDPIYHGDWDYATPDWTLTDGFVWNWSVTGGDPLEVTFSQNAAEDNYVEIVIATAGTYEISVTEEAPTAYGGCVGDPTTLDIEVVDIPTAVLDGAGTSESFCETDGGIPSVINATISDGWQNYRLVWTLEIATLSGSPLIKDEWFDTDLSTSLGNVLDYAVEYTTAVPEEVAADGAHNIMTVGSFGVINNKPTVYTYTLTSINDQAYRFGDFIDLGGDDSDPSAFRYNAIGETYSIQINPAPATGPIYHIPATWAN